MPKLFGLRVIRHGFPDATVWVSPFSSQIAPKIAEIQKQHPTALFEQLESDLIIAEEGVFLCEGGYKVRIKDMDEVKALGYVFSYIDGKEKATKFSFEWYLNGQPVLQGYPPIKEFVSL